MSLLNSIQRGRRDWSLLLRTNPAAIVAVGLLAVSACCLLAAIGGNILDLIRLLLIESFILALLLSWWLEHNRRFSADVRRTVFRHAACYSDETARRAFYSSAHCWLIENALSSGRANKWIWGWTTVRAFENLEPALWRRSRGNGHLELVMYQSLSEATQREMSQVLDDREEAPNYFDANRNGGAFANRWFVTSLIMYLLLTMLLGISPAPLRDLPKANTVHGAHGSMPTSTSSAIDDERPEN